MTPTRRATLPAWQKLVTGFAAAGLVAWLGYGYERQALLARLGSEAAEVMLANHVADGAARWTSPAGWTSRTARLSGSADAATRARIAAELAARPGIHSVVWAPR